MPACSLKKYIIGGWGRVYLYLSPRTTPRFPIRKDPHNLPSFRHPRISWRPIRNYPQTHKIWPFGPSKPVHRKFASPLAKGRIPPFQIRNIWPHKPIFQRPLIFPNSQRMLNSKSNWSHLRRSGKISSCRQNSVYIRHTFKIAAFCRPIL